MLNLSKFTPPSAQSVLAACAMTFIGGMGLLMCFHEVPTSNHDFIVFILGALSGAITVSGAAKAVSSLTTSSGTDTAPVKDTPTTPIV